LLPQPVAHVNIAVQYVPGGHDPASISHATQRPSVVLQNGSPPSPAQSEFVRHGVGPSLGTSSGASMGVSSGASIES
jgi:hypothetical protein